MAIAVIPDEAKHAVTHLNGVFKLLVPGVRVFEGRQPSDLDVITRTSSLNEGDIVAVHDLGLNIIYLEVQQDAIVQRNSLPFQPLEATISTLLVEGGGEDDRFVDSRGSLSSADGEDLGEVREQLQSVLRQTNQLAQNLESAYAIGLQQLEGICIILDITLNHAEEEAQLIWNATDIAITQVISKRLDWLETEPEISFEDVLFEALLIVTVELVTAGVGAFLISRACRVFRKLQYKRALATSGKALRVRHQEQATALKNLKHKAREAKKAIRLHRFQAMKPHSEPDLSILPSGRGTPQNVRNSFISQSKLTQQALRRKALKDKQNATLELKRFNAEITTTRSELTKLHKRLKTPTGTITPAERERFREAVRLSSGIEKNRHQMADTVAKVVKEVAKQAPDLSRQHFDVASSSRRNAPDSADAAPSLSGDTIPFQLKRMANHHQRRTEREINNLRLVINELKATATAHPETLSIILPALRQVCVEITEPTPSLQEQYQREKELSLEVEFTIWALMLSLEYKVISNVSDLSTAGDPLNPTPSQRTYGVLGAPKEIVDYLKERFYFIISVNLDQAPQDKRNGHVTTHIHNPIAHQLAEALNERVKSFNEKLKDLSDSEKPAGTIQQTVIGTFKPAPGLAAPSGEGEDP